MAASAFALYAMTFGVPAARHLQGLPPRVYLATGLLLATGAGLVGMLTSGSFLQGTWSSLNLPAIGKLGTPLLFDIGVCLVVIGMATMIVYELAESFSHAKQADFTQPADDTSLVKETDL